MLSRNRIPKIFLRLSQLHTTWSKGRRSWHVARRGSSGFRKGPPRGVGRRNGNPATRVLQRARKAQCACTPQRARARSHRGRKPLDLGDPRSPAPKPGLRLSKLRRLPVVAKEVACWDARKDEPKGPCFPAMTLARSRSQQRQQTSLAFESSIAIEWVVCAFPL